MKKLLMVVLVLLVVGSVLGEGDVITVDKAKESLQLYLFEDASISPASGGFGTTPENLAGLEKGKVLVSEEEGKKQYTWIGANEIYVFDPSTGRRSGYKTYNDYTADKRSSVLEGASDRYAGPNQYTVRTAILDDDPRFLKEESFKYYYEQEVNDIELTVADRRLLARETLAKEFEKIPVDLADNTETVKRINLAVEDKILTANEANDILDTRQEYFNNREDGPSAAKIIREGNAKELEKRPTDDPVWNFISAEQDAESISVSGGGSNTESSDIDTRVESSRLTPTEAAEKYTELIASAGASDTNALEAEKRALQLEKEGDLVQAQVQQTRAIKLREEAKKKYQEAAALLKDPKNNINAPKESVYQQIRLGTLTRTQAVEVLERQLEAVEPGQIAQFEKGQEYRAAQTNADAAKKAYSDFRTANYKDRDAAAKDVEKKNEAVTKAETALEVAKALSNKRGRERRARNAAIKEATTKKTAADEATAEAEKKLKEEDKKITEETIEQDKALKKQQEAAEKEAADKETACGDNCEQQTTALEKEIAEKKKDKEELEQLKAQTVFVEELEQFEAYQTVKGFGKQVRAALGTIASLGSYRALSSVLLPKTTKNYVDFFDEVFKYLEINIDAWADAPSYLARNGIGAIEGCGFDDEKNREKEGQSVGFIYTQAGTLQFIGRINAERSTRKAPILCDPGEEGFTCGSGLECRDEEFCYAPNSDTPAMGKFYKIDWALQAPQDEKSTPFVDENGISVKFNIQLQGNSNLWIFQRRGSDPKEVLGLQNGARDGGVIAKYLPDDYSRVCIKLSKPITDADGDEIKELCTTFIESEKGVVERAGANTVPSVTSQDAEVTSSI